MDNMKNGDAPLHSGNDTPHLTVIGGGLAGCEAAWQAAELGVDVTLFEMRPTRLTPAHATDRLAELVCSNSLGSTLPDRAGGMLLAEMSRLGSMIVAAAHATSVPAGGALAVDRDAFAEQVTSQIGRHSRIELRREEVTEIPPGVVIIATGPLTSDALAARIAEVTGSEHLYFFDALCPIVAADSIDMDIAFRQSRYDRGQSEAGDYINCPLDRTEFEAFHAALVAAERIEMKDFEADAGAERFFERCLPIEVIAERGPKSLAFGPMRPVGLAEPRTGKRPYAVVQLRQDNLAGTLYNIVGFQTNLRWPEQARVLRMIPGLAEAEFVRLGQMHRNTFICSPKLLDPTLAMRERPQLAFAGQITGIEGYAGNAASGIVAGVNAARRLLGLPPRELPTTTMLGALCHYVTHAEPDHFQPMKSNFGLLPPLEPAENNKRLRNLRYGERSAADLDSFLEDAEWRPPQVHLGAIDPHESRSRDSVASTGDLHPTLESNH